MGYCRGIQQDAWKLSGFQNERLSSLAYTMDDHRDLVAALQLFDVSGNEASPPMDELESLLGKDYRGFFVLSILQLLPQARAIYQGLGLPDALFRFTMADIPLNMQVYQRIHGCLGLSEGQLSWLQLHLAGELFRLGRLQFMRRCLEEDSRFGELSLPKGMALLDVHIPADGPLDRAACLDSYR